MDSGDNLDGDDIREGDEKESLSLFNGVDGGNDTFSLSVGSRVFISDSLLGVLLLLAFSDDDEVSREDEGGVDNVSLLAVTSCWVCDGSESSFALQWGKWLFSLLNVFPQYGHTPVVLILQVSANTANTSLTYYKTFRLLHPSQRTRTNDLDVLGNFVRIRLKFKPQ